MIEMIMKLLFLDPLSVWSKLPLIVLLPSFTGSLTTLRGSILLLPKLFDVTF